MTLSHHDPYLLLIMISFRKLYLHLVLRFACVVFCPLIFHALLVVRKSGVDGLPRISCD